VLDFFVGSFSIDEFKKYYSTLRNLQEYYISRTHRQPGPFELGRDEERYVESDPHYLIIWRDKGEIVGHCIWHKTSIEEMSPGNPRDDDDKECLRLLFGGEKDNLVELHELWLRTEHRGKGFDEEFFDFLENYVSMTGFDGIVYYTDHKRAVALCRKRGYREDFLDSSGLYVFALPFSID
jgi:GNAT superfamily N-acetyltransferase